MHIVETEKEAYLNLLEASFAGIKAGILRYEQLGFSWDSKPFLKKANGELLSHVGFIEYPMQIEGQWYTVGALHAICTKTTHRKQGLASELIQEALAWAKSQYELVVLFTEIPRFYEKFAFHPIQEYRFHLPCPHLKGSQLLEPLTSPKDDALLRRCFHTRELLSNHVWVKDTGVVASFNALFATYPTYWSLHYSPSIDGILSYQLEGKTLHLFDVIASKIPSLDAILDHLPAPIDEICFYFSPDRLTATAIPEPYLYDHGHFLVHGHWPTTKPFMVSPLSRC